MPSRVRIVLAIVVWAALSAGSIFLLVSAHDQARRETEQRFALRASIASRFVTTFVHDLIVRQARQAQRHLSSPVVSEATFATTVADADFAAAVLLDRAGRVLQVAPPSPALLGKYIAAKYQHLEAGVAGRVAVSNVVPSAVRGVPVVALAVPYTTSAGRRVYSGAYDIGATPVGSYLYNAIPMPHSRLYLVDANGVVIAKNRAPERGERTLASIEPALARSLTKQRAGAFAAGGHGQRYASSAIAGTPWTVVVAVRSSVLYSPVNQGTKPAWVVVIGFIMALALTLVLILRAAGVRVRLAALNDLLEDVIRVDQLTSLNNRRGLDEHLNRAVGFANRRRQPLAVLLLDIDHFKLVNDAHGHQAGDVVLVAVAAAIQETVRGEDVVGRWGGEEFIAILPETGSVGAATIAERLRAAVAALAIELPDGLLVMVTASIGVSVAKGESVDERIKAADQALYAAKRSGRNRVEVGGPDLVPAIG